MPAWLQSVLMKQRARKSGAAAYLRRLAAPAFGWIMLGVAAVLITNPSRVGLLLSGAIPWWRLAAFAAFALVLGLGAAAIGDWNRRRERNG